MYKSKTISVQIERPWEEVFEFLLDPLNFLKWRSMPGGMFENIGGSDWRADTPLGRVILRWATRNPFGILDNAVIREGEDVVTTPMRAFPNGDGTEITFTYFQREGVSDQKFASEVEWITADFALIKAQLEGANIPVQQHRPAAGAAPDS